MVFAPHILLVCHVLRLRVNKCCFIEKKAKDKSKSKNYLKGSSDVKGFALVSQAKTVERRYLKLCK